MWGLLWNFTPTFLLHMKWDSKCTLPIQTNEQLIATKTALKKQQQHNHFLINLVWQQMSFLCAFRAVKVQSEWLSFHMSHHYVVDGRKKGDGEMKDSEKQSCSLMVCKVISCGLVKLKAASLGCNSWQSCPPFTLANPSFRAFSHNQRFMERGSKRGLCEARKKMMTTKVKLQSGTGWKAI